MGKPIGEEVLSAGGLGSSTEAWVRVLRGQAGPRPDQAPQTLAELVDLVRGITADRERHALEAMARRPGDEVRAAVAGGERDLARAVAGPLRSAAARLRGGEPEGVVLGDLLAGIKALEPGAEDAAWAGRHLHGFVVTLVEMVQAHAGRASGTATPTEDRG